MTLTVLVNELGYTPNQLLALDKQTRDSPEVPNRLVETHYEKADQEFKALRKVGFFTGTFPVAGYSYPVAVTTYGHCHRVLARALIKRTDEMTVLLACKHQDHTKFTIHTQDPVLDVGHLARSFGGKGDEQFGQFIVEMAIDDFLL